MRSEQQAYPSRLDTGADLLVISNGENGVILELNWPTTALDVSVITKRNDDPDWEVDQYDQKGYSVPL
jgi:hypothetical protein